MGTHAPITPTDPGEHAPLPKRWHAAGLRSLATWGVPAMRALRTAHGLAGSPDGSFAHACLMRIGGHFESKDHGSLFVLHTWAWQWARCGAPTFMPTQSCAAAFALTDPRNALIADAAWPFDAMLVTMPHPHGPIRIDGVPVRYVRCWRSAMLSGNNDPTGDACSTLLGHAAMLFTREVDVEETELTQIKRRIDQLRNAAMPADMSGKKERRDELTALIRDIDDAGIYGARATDRVRNRVIAALDPAIVTAALHAPLSQCRFVEAILDDGTDRLYMSFDDAKAATVGEWAASFARIDLDGHVADAARDRACGMLVAQIANLCLYLRETRVCEAPRKPRSGRPLRGDELPPPLSWVVGREIKLSAELRAAAAAQADGDRSPAHWRLARRFVVRGHWRRQACGAARAERRPKWIAPYWKGPAEGPALTRMYSVEG